MTCPEKRWYSTRRAAKEALRRMQRDRVPDGNLLRAYSCAVCPGFHVGRRREDFR